MNDEMLTTKEVAAILKVSPRAVNKMLKYGRLRGLHISGEKRKTYRFLRGEIDRFVAEQYEKQTLRGEKNG